MKLWVSILIILQISSSYGLELKGLQLFIQFITGEFLESKSKTPENLLNKNGTCKLIDYLQYADYHMTRLEVLDTLNKGEKKKSRVKCTPTRGNGTLYILHSLKDVMNILATNSASIPKDEPHHNCVIMLFYSKSCPGSSQVAPHFNALARSFKDIKVAALDAQQNPEFNTEFGIIGLPTIMLFSQGRIIQKFNNTKPSTVNNMVNFITKYTNLKAPIENIVVTSEDFFNEQLKSTVEDVTDYYLYLSWIFIIVCSIYYFTRSKLYTQLVEMINRNWMESAEALQQHN